MATDGPGRRRAQRDAPLEAPPGFEVVDADAGAGKTSRVAKVRRTADGALFAWKRAVAADDDVRRAMEEQTERSLEWVRIGVAAAPSVWAADGVTLLQPWVEGPTLRHVMDSTAALTDAADPRHAALVEFVRRIAAASRFVSGLNAMNLVYDGAAWRIVDSGHVAACASPSVAWSMQRADLLRKWTRGPLAGRRADVLAFLSAADRALALPPPPFSLRRWWRGLRGR